MADPVLLVNANRTRPPIAPLALDYLADALGAAGRPYSVVDLCFAESIVGELASAVANQAPLLVAITFRNTDDCYCATRHSFIPQLQALVAQVRQVTDAPVVVGGAGYSTAPEGILRRVGADFGLRGDGERALVELAQTLASKGDPTGIAGLVWGERGEIRANAPAWAPLAEGPLARRAVDNERYFREGGQGSVETKRGCPRGCIFCADHLGKGTGVRVRPPAAVAEEMMSLAARGVDCFHLCDSEFNVDAGHAEAVCRELIARGGADRLQWYAYLAPRPFSPEMARSMKQAGCAGINFGTDSGDAEMLRRLGRDHTPEDIVGAVRACRENGIPVMIDLLLGAPGETRQSVETTIRLMKQIEPTCVGVGLGVRIYPDTAIARTLRVPDRGPEGLVGEIEGNDDLALPLFYLEPALGDNPVGLLKELIAGDERFFFGWPDDTQADYNYDDNPELTRAIADGHRGAYWDILRKLRGLGP
jgi:radical SAM superfamily enzyme YgiQ (UPF0313 family)